MLLRDAQLEEKLSIYKSLLVKWSKAINLVAPSTLKEIEIRHFQDSLQLLDFIPETAKTLFDFGSGAGFPALVLAMAKPDLAVHVFESDQRKCAFMGAVSRETFIPVIIHNERVENVDIKTLPTPDVISARALAPLRSLLDLSRVWWEGREELLLLFPKGEKAEAEILEAKMAYSFDLEICKSKTDPRAKILQLRNVKSLI
ncbi:MAG: 16S rRNA (guanine(527)-N(7))-methyltransferase RsmG [Pseudobdellovibrionaceae bacterium]|nr:16S rRNA (guanine(527)-N(7))-methyltransferase RsmG [Pseudobdellovibrionaceae bacterium]